MDRPPSVTLRGKHPRELLDIAEAFAAAYPDRIGVGQGVGWVSDGITAFAYRTKAGAVVVVESLDG